LTPAPSLVAWPWTRRSTVRGVVTVATLGDAVAVFMPLL
jgi:hypothetical protein